MSRFAGACRFVAAVAVPIGFAACGGSSPTTTPPPAASVATVLVSPATATLAATQTVQLTATPKDSAGNALSGRTISWSSTAPGVASVNASGMVTAVSAGTASVTATTGGKSGTAAISVGESTTMTAAGGTMTAAGGNVVLQFPAGALASSTAITVAPASAPAGSTGTIPGSIYEFGPTGTQFPNNILATVKYDPALLPAGTAASDLHLYTWNGGSSWTRMLGTRVDSVHHTVSALIPHFSLFSPCGIFCFPVAPPVIPGLDLIGGWVEVWNPDGTLLTGGALQIINQGGNSSVGSGAVESSGGTINNLSLSLAQICYTQPCLPAGSITASYNVGASHDYTTYISVSYTFVIHVAATTPPGVWPVTMVASGLVAGNAVQGSSFPLYITVPAPGYTPSLSSTTLTATQGGSTGSTVNLVRAGGFTGTVALSVEGLPSGAAATLTPASVSGTSSSLTITVGSSVSPRDYNLTLRSSTSGFADQLTPFSLTVTGSGFALTGTPPFINAAAGATAKTGIKATRVGGFGGTITYAVSGLPSGLSAAITSSGVADSSVLTVTASAGLAAGSYPITITGTANGAATQQLTVTVTIVPAGVVGIHLDFTACSQASTPVWAAYQDGTGPWTHVTITGSTADFNISSSKAAVAIVYPSGSAFSTQVTYLTQAELLTYNTNGGFYSGCGSPTGKTITASVVGANDVYVSMGGGFAGPIYPGVPLQLTNVASGSQDAFAMTLTGTFTQLGTPKAIIRRDQSILNGGSLAPFDFTTGEAFVPLTGTGSAGGGASVNANMQYVSVNNGVCVTNNLYQSLVSQSGNFPIYGFPTNLQRPGDLHRFAAADPSGQGASQTFHTFGNQNLTFGGAIAPTVTATAGTYRLLTAALTVPGAYQNIALGYFDASGSGNSVTLQASTNYFAGGGVTLATPDFGSIGFLASWGPTANGTANYSVFAASTNNFTSTPASLCADGLSIRTASVHGVK